MDESGKNLFLKSGNIYKMTFFKVNFEKSREFSEFSSFPSDRYDFETFTAAF